MSHSRLETSGFWRNDTLICCDVWHLFPTDGCLISTTQVFCHLWKTTLWLKHHMVYCPFYNVLHVARDYTVLFLLNRRHPCTSTNSFLQVKKTWKSLESIARWERFHSTSETRIPQCWGPLSKGRLSSKSLSPLNKNLNQQNCLL